ncbi:MAG TPA: hydroxysqualene dehydroxylase HpnE [Candidatus Kapabacteria bacterium]|nr:hydroxysqualene dehydroxylase HpnE [Candidatus Kapabacteria bacterium]
MQENSKIAIIGAGVSGLAAAVALSQSGCRNLTLFEARREAGGRTRSYHDPTTGDTLDNGQHLMMGCYHSTLSYVRAIGSEHLLQRAPLWIHFHEASRNVPAILRLSPNSNLLAGLWRSRFLTPREKFAATRLGLSIDASSAKNCEGITCAALFRKLHQPAGLIKKLWAPIVLATINAPVEQASAVLFINVLREAFLSGHQASDLLLPKSGLSDLLIDPALRMLEKNGTTVRLSTPARAIEKKDSALRIATNDSMEDFDAAIYCGQSSDPLPQEIRSSIPEFEYSPIVNAYFWLDRPLLRGPIHEFLGTTLQWAFPWPSNFAAERLALTVSAGNTLAERTNEEIRHILWTDLCTTIPEAREARLMHHQIIREKRATPLFTPTVQQSRPLASTNVPRLFIGGDLVQNGLPATIEGAVRNGFAAAELLIKKFVPEL